MTLLDKQKSPNSAPTFKYKFVGAHLAVLCAVLWSSYMRRITLNYEITSDDRNKIHLLLQCPALHPPTHIPECWLSFSTRYSRADTLGRETGVENKAWPTWDWQQILRVIFILILSKCKGNAWSCAFSPYILMYTAHTIKCHHVFGWESLLLRGRKVWREGGRWSGVETQLLSLL